MVELEVRDFQGSMACHAMHSWTFTGLIGAFVELTIAYFLLCASAVAFLASIFLGFFGLSLPCPCNGVFANSNSNLCWQRQLIDGPMERVSSVQLSVKSRFPFCSSLERDQTYHLNVKLLQDRDSGVDGYVGVEGEGSCSSTLGPAKKSSNMEGKDLVLRNESNMGTGIPNSSLDFKEKKIDRKGKGNINQRPRIALRRRRKAVDSNKVSSLSEYSPSCSDDRSPYVVNDKGCEKIQCNLVPIDSGADVNQLHYDDWLMKDVRKSTSPGLELESIEENNLVAENMLHSEELESNGRIELPFNGNVENEIRILEHALEQERAVRSTLYLELEKERSAAATAADEAMAMILRLQEEKASVEMEARQFQRMIEEKSAYDAEEMTILKEIIVRREREKHFLEKEVEAYRATAYDGNASGELAPSLNLGEDPVLLLQQLSESIDNNGIGNDKSLVNEEPSSYNKKYSLPSSSGEQSVADKTVILSAKRQDENDNAFQLKGDDLMLDMETHVHDVHVIDDCSDLLKGTREEKKEELLVNDGNSNAPGICSVVKESVMGSSCSDLIVGLPPLGGIVEEKPRVSDLKGNSISGVDDERVKIDSEVGWLRERLRIVQEERERLNFSMEGQEREMFQVQLLDEIACQLREIRELTSQGQAVRQASLPLPPPKVLSKKRRHRSVSAGVHETL